MNKNKTPAAFMILVARVASSVCNSYHDMDDKRLVLGCVAILLLSFTVHCQDEICGYQYRLQPGKGNCYPESPLHLELKCQVSGSNNFTIQWHYSNSTSAPAKGNSTSMETILDIETIPEVHESMQVLGGGSVISVLTLMDYNMADGYYWCTVNASDSTPNPSQVLNISTCPFIGDEVLTKCEGKIGLFETPITTRCADHPVNITIVNEQLGSTELCATKIPVTTLDIKEPIHTSESLITTDSYTSEELTTTDGTFTNRDQSTSSPSSRFPMHYVWMIVAIVFTLLIAIIIVMLIAIIYLNHKKNKIRVSSSSRNHIHNPYVEYSNPDSLKRDILLTSSTGAATGQPEIQAEAGYEIPMNVIHAHNAAFGGDQSPDSKTSSSRSALHSAPGEYEEVGIVKATRDSIKSTQRHQYELVESGEQSEYSHLQHAHGGSQKRKFSTNSTGTAPAPPPLPSTSNSQGKVSITSSLSLSGHQPGPIFDSLEYMTIELDGSKSTKTQPQTGEDLSVDAGYSHINHKALKGRDTTQTEGPDQDSDGYHQLPSVFTEAANNHIKGQPSGPERQNSHITKTHPPAHRHNSATTASDPYTPIESANVMKRNTYSFSIVSTDEQYVSERGHVYHLLERSDEHQQSRSCPGSNEGSPKFRIQEEDSAKDRSDSSSIPPYSQVNKSPKQASNEQKDTEQSNQSEDQSDCSSPQGSSTDDSRKVIPPYSQVDKSKKKNRRPQAQLDHDAQDSQETHHYHVLEQNSNEKIEEPCGEKGGPIYHIIDHES